MKNHVKINRYVCMLITLVLLLSLPLNSFGANAGIDHDIDATGAYLTRNIPYPTYGIVGGDWLIIGLARSGIDLPKGYIDNYVENVENVLKEKNGELTRNKYSEYSRLILSFTAIGKDPTDVAGYNLVEKISDLKAIEKQGINGPIYALIALDSVGYSIPKTSQGVQTTRELLIASILDRELKDGGFSLSGTAADPDVTAAVLQALSTYKNKSDVKAVIDRGLAFLSSVQTDRGGFKGLTTGGVENCESVAQVIIALTSLGINPATDERFIKLDSNGQKHSLLDAMDEFRLEEGIYLHLLEGGPDIMATEQALLALTSYKRLISKENSLFDMGDVSKSDSSAGADYKYKILLNGEYLTFDQPPINRDSRILVPMRAIFEALGADVQWDNDLRKATGVLENSNVSLIIGSKTAYANGKAIELDTPAIIENKRTLVPVRFISESLNAVVDWDSDTNTAVITTR